MYKIRNLSFTPKMMINTRVGVKFILNQLILEEFFFIQEMIFNSRPIKISFKPNNSKIVKALEA